MRRTLLLVLLAPSCSSGTTDPEPPLPPPGPGPGGNTVYVDATADRFPRATNRFTMDVALADFDGDGDSDVLLAVEFGQNRLLINDGSGRFTDLTSGRLPTAFHDSEDIGVADFDGDGDLDAIVVSEDDRTNELYVNDGSGVFQSVPLPVTGTSNGVVVGDIDGDGDPDLVIGNAGPEFVLVNDGTGGWSNESSSRLPEGASGITQDVELGDVDLDGDLDLLLGNEDGNRLFFNDGNGFFTDVTDTWIPFRATREETREADLGDIDGDGDLDVFFANTRSSFPSADPADRLLRNDGDRFTDVTASQLPADEDRSFDGEFWDVDGDGDLDIVVGNFNAVGGQAAAPSPYRVLVNDGAGMFTDGGSLLFPGTAVAFGFDSEMADLDGDGDGDFVLGSRGSQDLLLIRGGS